MSLLFNKRLKMLAVSFGLACLELSYFCLAVEAATPRQIVSDSSRSLKNHTDQLVQQVQAFLQAGGRWAPAPQGQDMQLCQALQSFQKRVGRVVSDNQSGSYDTVRSDLQELEFQSQLVVPLLNQVGANQAVQSAWMLCRSDLLSISHALSLVPSLNSAMFYDAEAGVQPGFGGSGYAPAGINIVQQGVSPLNPFNQANPSYSTNNSGNPYQPVIPGSVISQSAPGSPFYPGLKQTNIHITRNSTFDSNPGFQSSTETYSSFAPGGQIPANQIPANNHFSSAVFSNLSGAENQTERFVKQLTLYLQAKGQWPPNPASTEMLLCQHLQSFQTQMRRFREDLQSNLSYPVLQSSMQHLGSCSQSIDQLLLEISAPPDLTSRWNEVRTYMNSTYQSFLSAGSSGYIWMR